MKYDRDAVIAKAIDALNKAEDEWGADQDRGRKMSAAWLKVADRMDKDSEVQV